ncbi:uncharacterized protein LOC111325924 [Stylophora pistillata]|uniref:uncharacterized protein LOC111325924 n=1 Tax=Stylophora pistillata TaxID=50429 RepID=UPI000C03A156|nr:uncharacterized protein LOC111325924 [Stylophora pistillata]XP_022785578.1 uncharacterized protein LOC111325924 [Stylophora pistillata]
MGRQLIECEATFRDAVSVVNNLLKNLGVTWNLMDELMANEGESRISENYIAQPATFAIQYATAKLIMSWKIHPSAVIGQSLGEIAAACIAGIITVKEAVQLVLARSTLQDKCAEDGGMAALGMSEAKARALLESLQLSHKLDIAAVNDADSVTVAGESQSIEILGQHLVTYATDIFWCILGTKRAFHTIYMEPIKEPFFTAVKRINLKPQLSKIPMYSTVKGEVLSGQQFNGDYWWQNIRSPVQFYPAMKQILSGGFKQIIEISAQPMLAHYVKQIARQENLKDQETPVVLATLPRKRVPVEDQHKSFLLNTVCQLYTMGHSIDWTCVQKNPSAEFVRSLNYPWLEKSFWFDERSTFATIPPIGSKKTAKESSHPFLPKEKMADPYSHLHCWETEIDLHRFPTLKDHSFIQGGAVMPGAVYLEMAFGMVKDKFTDVAGLELSDVNLYSILTLPETQVRCLRLRLEKSNRINEAQFHITSVQDDESEINLSRGNISIDLLESRHSFDNTVPMPGGSTINELKADMEQMPVESFKRLTEKFGFNYGSKFSLIKQIWHRDNEGFCLIDISESPTIQNESSAYVLHPCIIDACLQSCFVALGELEGDDTSIVPVGFKSVTLNHVPSTNQLYCHAIETKLGSFDVRLMSPCGRVLLTMGDFRLAGVTSTEREYLFEELRYEVQ